MKKIVTHTSVQTALLALAVISTFATVLTSCEKEIYAEEPQYEKLFFSADSIDFDGVIKPAYSFSPGQTVYAGVLIASDGAYITRADETWTLKGNGIDDLKQTKSVVAPCGKEPTWTFQAPDSVGSYTVTFKEKYSFSASKPDGTIFGQSQTITASFNVR